MEQRKRESMIPKGAFGGGVEALADDDSLRGDVSGMFARPITEIPAQDTVSVPLARVELRRTAPPPPPPEALVRSALHAIVPPAMHAPGSTPSLYALVAPTYPPPAPSVLELEPEPEPERVEFPDFATRLDVPQMAPAPSSLLPLPGEERPTSLRWVAAAALLVVVGVGGWLSRDLLVSANVSSAARTFVADVPAPAPVVAVAPLAVEPVAVEPLAVEPVAVAPLAVEPVAVEPLAVEPVASTPLPVAPTAIRRVPVAVAQTAVAPEPTAAEPSVAVVAPAVVAPTTVAIEPAAATADPAEATAPAAEPAPLLETALVAELPETLERAEVIEGIEKLRNDYQACVGELHGTAELKLIVANTGRISHAVVGGKYAGTPQGSCLARTLRQARFRSFLQPRIEIAYPLAL